MARSLKLKQAIISALSPTRYARNKDVLNVGYSTVGFILAQAPDPRDEAHLEVGFEFQDFLFGHAIPPKSEETIGVGFEVEDFIFKPHPLYIGSDQVGTAFEVSDFVFKHHPLYGEGQSLSVGFGFEDFEYTGGAVEEPVTPMYLDEMNKRPAVAWSLDQLIVGATRSVRVRRSNDDEQDINFTGNALNVAQLLDFVGAGDGYVVKIYDQVTGSYPIDFTSDHARQPKIVAAGVYLGTMSFDGVGNWGITPVLPMGTAYLDMYMIATPKSLAGNVMVELSSNYNNVPGGFIYYWHTLDNGLNIGVQGNAANTERRNSFPGATSGSEHLVTMLSNRSLTGTDEIQVFQDGVSLAPTAIVSNELSGNFQPYSLYVGSRNGTYHDTFDLKTIVLYTNNSAGIRTRVEDVLKRDVMWNPLVMAPRFVFDDRSLVTLNGGLERWSDRSGNSIHLTNTTSGKPVLNAIPGERRSFQFNGSSSQLAMAANSLDMFRNVGSGWIFTLYKNDTDPGVAERPILFHSTATAANARLSINAGTAALANRYSAGGRRLDAQSYVAQTSPTARSATWTMAISLIDYTNRTITTHINGTFEATATTQFDAAGSSSNTASAGVWVGRNGANSAFFKGALAALVGGVTLPAPDEIDSLFGYYAHRFGLAASLPGGHPYKLAPPTLDNDPYWMNVASVTNYRGADASTTISDGKGLAWTARGNAQLDTDVSANGTSSLKLDGSGDWADTPDAYQLRTTHSEFTMEAFFRTDALNRNSVIFNKRTSGTGEINLRILPENVLEVTVWGSLGGAYCICGVTPISTGSMYHVEVGRSGNAIYLFLNGVLEGTVKVGESLLTKTDIFRVGRDGLNTAHDFSGWIGGFRRTNGVCRHTSNFAPPTAPFATAGGGVTVPDMYREEVVSQLSFPGADGSTSIIDERRLRWSVTGAVEIDTSLGYGVALFDGSSVITTPPTGYFSRPASTAMSYEIAGRLSALTGTVTLMDNRPVGVQGAYPTVEILADGTLQLYISTGVRLNTLAGAIVVGTDFHVEVTVDIVGGWRMFLNGVQIGTVFTSNNAIPITGMTLGGRSHSPGQYLTGYISAFRVTRGVCKHIAGFISPGATFPPIPHKNLVSLFHADGEDGSLAFQDEAGIRWEATGTAMLTQSHSRFGLSSADFLGTVGLLRAINYDVMPGYADYTAEVFCRVTEARIHGVLNLGQLTTATRSAVTITSTGAVRWYTWDATAGTTDFQSAAGVINLNTWYHIAVVKSASGGKIFVNGIEVASTGSVVPLMGDGVGRPVLGAAYISSGNNYLRGQLDEFRLTYNEAIYTTNFTPPSGPFRTDGTVMTPKTSSVPSLLHFDGANLSTTFTDAMGLIWTRAGDAQIGTAQSKFGGSSGRFDGVTGYLTTPRDGIEFGTADFAIEMWVRPVAHTSGYPCLFSNYSSFTTGSLSLFAGHNAADPTKFQVACNGTFPAIQSTTSIAYNAWTHLAVVRVGGILKLYVNGVEEGTFNATGVVLNGSGASVALGASPDYVASTTYDGWMDEFRVTYNSSVYTTTFVPPSAAFAATVEHIGAIDPYVTSVLQFEGSNGGTFIHDQMDVTWYREGTAALSNTTSKFGTASLRVANSTSDDAVKTQVKILPTNGTTPFTVQVWARFDTLTSGSPNAIPYLPVFSQGANMGNGDQMFGVIDGVVGMFCGSGLRGTGLTLKGRTAVPVNTWVLLEMSYDGTNLHLFLDGRLEVKYATAVGWVDNSFPIRLGRNVVSGHESYRFSMNGYIGGMRVSNGICRFTDTHAVPNRQFYAGKMPDSDIDQYWEDVVALLSFEANHNPGTLASAFTEKFGNTVVVSGSPKATAARKRHGVTSVVFDGSLNNDQVNMTTAQLIEGQYAVDGWAYRNTTATSRTCCLYSSRSNTSTFAKSGAYVNPDGSVTLREISGTATENCIATSAAAVVPTGSWFHWAVTKSGTVLRGYINGVKVVELDSVVRVLSAQFNVGMWESGSFAYVWDGYIDSVRLTNNPMRYLANFTPPTSAHPTQGPTLASKLQFNGPGNGTVFTDDTGKVWTRVGTATTVNTFSRNGSAVGSFPNASYLTTPSYDDFNFGMSDFTIESWVRFNATNSTYGVIACRDQIGGTRGWVLWKSPTDNKVSFSVWSGGAEVLLIDPTVIQPGIWEHYAVVRDGDVVRMYRNGVEVASAAFTGSVNAPNEPCVIGALWGVGAVAPNADRLDARLDNFRITKGFCHYKGGTRFYPDGLESNTAAVVTGNVSSLLHFNGTDASTTFTDETGKTWTVSGAAQTDTAQSVYGGSSGLFNGTDAYIDSPVDAGYTFGTGASTVEFWVRPTNVTAGWRSIVGDNLYPAVGGWRIYQNGTSIQVWVDIGQPQHLLHTHATALQANVWTHVAWVRTGTISCLFINGILSGSTTTNYLNFVGTGVRVGLGVSGANNYYFNGHVEELRIVKGQALYRGNFIPPQVPFANPAIWQGTSANYTLDQVGETGGVYSYRYLIPQVAVRAAATQVRLTLNANSSGVTIDQMALGLPAASGDLYDFAATPQIVTVGGLAAFTIPADGTVVTDPVTITVPASGGLLLAFHKSAGGVKWAHNSDGVPWKLYFLATGTSDVMTVNASGYTENGSTPPFFVKRVECFAPP